MAGTGKRGKQHFSVKNQLSHATGKGKHVGSAQNQTPKDEGQEERIAKTRKESEEGKFPTLNSSTDLVSGKHFKTERGGGGS